MAHIDKAASLTKFVMDWNNRNIGAHSIPLRFTIIGDRPVNNVNVRIVGGLTYGITGEAAKFFIEKANELEACSVEIDSTGGINATFKSDG